MNPLRRWLFGYKPVKAIKYMDSSYGSLMACTMVYWRSRLGKPIIEIQEGHWTLEELTGKSDGK